MVVSKLRPTRLKHSAARVLATAWRKYKRNKPSNAVCPISHYKLNEIKKPFDLIQSNGIVRRYNATVLAQYLMNSNGKLRDPETKEDISSPILRRLERVTGIKVYDKWYEKTIKNIRVPIAVRAHEVTRLLYDYITDKKRKDTSFHNLSVHQSVLLQSYIRYNMICSKVDQFDAFQNLNKIREAYISVAKSDKSQEGSVLTSLHILDKLYLRGLGLPLNLIFKEDVCLCHLKGITKNGSIYMRLLFTEPDIETDEDYTSDDNETSNASSDGEEIASTTESEEEDETEDESMEEDLFSGQSINVVGFNVLAEIFSVVRDTSRAL